MTIPHTLNSQTQGGYPMKEKAFTLDRGKRYLFYILMIAILGWFLFMQFFGADERSQEMSSGPVIYSGTFIWQKSDGTSEKITVPGKYKVPAGETMVLISQLPDTLQETDIAIRSSLQDVNVYINNELRTSYSTRETRLAGKNSASRYIFCPVSSSDAGKQLRIELTTYTSNYSGVVNTIYCGNKSDIWLSIFAEYGLSTGIAFFILFSGIISILFSFALGMVYKKRFDMEYLGWCMVMGAIWMLGESKMRQLLVPNASALGSLCFVMILLSPLPIILYADSIPERAAPPFLRMSRLDRTCQFCSLFCSGCNEKSRLYGNASRWAAAPCIYTYPYIYTSFSIYTGRAE